MAPPSRLFSVIFGLVLLIGLAYVGTQIAGDLGEVRASSAFPFVMLGVALLIALGFEFVNGFHDTANAVATVIYTHSLPPQIAVVWSGLFNFLGVLLSSGAVAFGIVSLLPVELILQVGSGAGFAMVFALLIAAIIWNLGTWWLGLPASSSHTLIGSIIGVGLANQLMATASAGTSGVDWAQATKRRQSAAVLAAGRLRLLGAAAARAARSWSSNRSSTRRRSGNAPPPSWIRGLLILTCTGVSFAHGSNDGQKGMGLIMLILIGTVPTAYALNHAVPSSQSPPSSDGRAGASASSTRRAAAARRAPGRRAARRQVTDAAHARESRDRGDLRRRCAHLAGDHRRAGATRLRRRWRQVPADRVPQRPQRHVPHSRGAPADAEAGPAALRRRRHGRADRLSRSSSTTRPSSFPAG